MRAPSAQFRCARAPGDFRTPARLRRESEYGRGERHGDGVLGHTDCRRGRGGPIYAGRCSFAKTAGRPISHGRPVRRRSLLQGALRCVYGAPRKRHRATRSASRPIFIGAWRFGPIPHAYLGVDDAPAPLRPARLGDSRIPTPLIPTEVWVGGGPRSGFVRFVRTPHWRRDVWDLG